MLVRLALIVLGVASLAATASAQAPLDEPRAAELRAQARTRAHEGNLEEALSLLRIAAPLTADARALVELGEAADRLRLDELALQSYEAYLSRAPNAEDHVEIAARARVLREVLAGHRYALAPATNQRNELLVDWNGRPVVVTSSRARASLANWDGDLHSTPPSQTHDLAPFPEDDRGLGRRLSPP